MGLWAIGYADSRLTAQKARFPMGKRLLGRPRFISYGACPGAGMDSEKHLLHFDNHALPRIVTYPSVTTVLST